ncbi:MAG: hypothetical protein AAGL24_10155 [Pseudomonadota bacterium]
MNKARRKAIDAIVARIDELKADVEIIRDEEQDYFDNMPEGIQDGEKGEVAQSAIDSLDDAVNTIDDIVESLNSAAE